MMIIRSFGRRLAVRLLQLAIGVVAIVVIPVLVICLLSPHSHFSRGALFSIHRTIQFPVSLWGRDKRCSIADVWAAGSPEPGQVEERIRDASKLVDADGKLVQVETPAGRFWIPARETEVLAEELAEQALEVYGRDVIHPGDVVLDCGANVGVYTRVALTKGAGKVVAIELAPQPLVCLRRNFERETREGRVIVYPKGVWDKDATLRLSLGPGLASSDGSVALDRGQLGPEVPLTTIDKLVAELKLTRVDVIKMDIEGSESHALTGAAQTLAAYKPRLAISMEHKRSDPDVIPALVRRLNPQYKMRCTACGGRTGRVQPEVLLAW
jgi:FkbM family methyltransferase